MLDFYSFHVGKNTSPMDAMRLRFVDGFNISVQQRKVWIEPISLVVIDIWISPVVEFFSS